MVVWFTKLQLALTFYEECFDMLGCLVVHEVNFGFEPFCGEAIELHFLCIENADVVKASNRCGQNCICFVMVQYKKTNAAIQQDERE